MSLTASAFVCRCVTDSPNGSVSEQLLYERTGLKVLALLSSAVKAVCEAAAPAVSYVRRAAGVTGVQEGSSP